MFTGIVQAHLPVDGVSHQSDLSTIRLKLGDLAENLQLGASVALNGTCLTVTDISTDVASFDVIKETLVTTNLGALGTGDCVNVERSMRMGDEIGGHIVSGHVTATAELVEQRVDGNDRVLTFSLAPAWLKYIFHKGFISLDGASLTVSSLNRNACQFCVSLIPETIKRTTLGHLDLGALVNVEVDSQTMSIVDTVEQVLEDPQRRQQWFPTSEQATT